jgi:uncharacterized protein YgiM (DUF1202 family)
MILRTFSLLVSAFFAFLAIVMFSNCAAVGLLAEAEIATLTSVGVRAVATRVAVGSAVRAGAARTSLMIADEALFSARASRIVLTRQGSRRFFRTQINNSEKNVLEVLNNRTLRTVESGQILNLPGDLYVVNTKGLNVRTGPGANYDKVAVVTKGRPLAVTSRKDGWSETWVTDEIKGWVKDQFIDAVMNEIMSPSEQNYTPQQPYNSTQMNQMNQNGLADADRDGVPNSFDDCINEAGKREMHGCPDDDGDGVPNKDDKCLGEIGVLRFYGCPDSDNDGVPNYEDRCPTILGEYANSGCPIRVQYLDSDRDGIPDERDYCPNDYARTISGCPYLFEEEVASSMITPHRTRPVHIGIGFSGGFVSSSLKNVDNDIDNIGGIGFSPYIFAAIRTGEKSRLQLDFCYSKRSFVFSNHGDDSEFGFGDVYYYNTSNAQMSFSDIRAYGKININSFYFGGYFGKVVKATRSGNIEYYSSTDDVFDDNYKYDFFDEQEYPLVNGERPINDFIYGATIGYEKIFRGGLLFGVGLDYSLSNYFNSKYSAGWSNYGDNLDLYPSSDIDLKLHYLYLNLGYRF